MIVPAAVRQAKARVIVLVLDLVVYDTSELSGSSRDVRRDVLRLMSTDVRSMLRCRSKSIVVEMSIDVDQC